MVKRFMLSPGRYLAAAPTNKQAKRIFWEDFKKLTPKEFVSDISNGELFIRLRTGSELHVAGMDAPDRVEGQMWNHVLLDEYGNMAERVWPEVISPVLADTGGGCDFTGVPEGRNHYYDLIHRMRHRDDVAVFHWPSWEILPKDEIEVQRENLDELTFAQEFGGEFVHFAGRAYYAFQSETHCRPVKQLYDQSAPISFCFDFNVDPGVAVVVQERELRNGQIGTAVIGEVFIPRNSNTEIVTRKLVEDWGEHQGRIHLFGDFTGGQRGTAKLQGSDWDIIKRVLLQRFSPQQIHDNVVVNPPVKKRINAMNSRLRSVSGTVRMMFDPEACPHTIKDMEGVTILEGSAGEIDKKSSTELTHLSDALGYYVHAMYPPEGSRAPKIGNLY